MGRVHRRSDNISLLIAGYAGTFQHMTQTPRTRIIYERNALVSMEMSFFALPSKQGPVQGRLKPTHLPISLSTKVAACVRRFETPTALSLGR
jgi:hypothetical protein